MESSVFVIKREISWQKSFYLVHVKGFYLLGSHCLCESTKVVCWYGLRYINILAWAQKINVRFIHKGNWYSLEKNNGSPTFRIPLFWTIEMQGQPHWTPMHFLISGQRIFDIFIVLVPFATSDDAYDEQSIDHISTYTHLDSTPNVKRFAIHLL